jgi:regulator of sirC expression with transglutaminase-like and TPR domain
MTLFLFAFVCLPQSLPAKSPAEIVRQTLSAPDGGLNYERAKIALDRIIDPNFNEADIRSEVDRLAAAAKRIAAGGNDIAKLKAVRQVIYEPGSWNGARHFSYDRADPYGIDLRNKLLATYLETRRGNCVSMPILHMVVAERLGLKVSLSTAPQHVFLRYTNPTTGRSLAIEATSGGHPTREFWYHEKMGVTQEQVNSGIYLAVLTKRETLAVMASTVTEWLTHQHRYAEAIEVADVLLKHHPKNVHALLSLGSAYGQLLQKEFVEQYPTPSTVPFALKPRYVFLASQKAAAFAQAESWGFKPPQTEQDRRN